MNLEFRIVLIFLGGLIIGSQGSGSSILFSFVILHAFVVNKRAPVAPVTFCKESSPSCTFRAMTRTIGEQPHPLRAAEA